MRFTCSAAMRVGRNNTLSHVNLIAKTALYTLIHLKQAFPIIQSPLCALEDRHTQTHTHSHELYDVMKTKHLADSMMDAVSDRICGSDVRYAQS